MSPAVWFCVIGHTNLETRMRLTYCFLLLILFALAISVTPSMTRAQIKQDGRVMFVLDGSNSMWGQIDGVAKISIAKEVMVDLIQDWDESVPVGLMIYGHRKKDDCRDIELVSGPGKINRKALIDKVQSISPRGKTPITQSLIEAALAINSTQGTSSVVLVSDGLETCNANPCAAAFSFNVLNPGFDVHVIGFDVNEEESKALRCIADRTGGKFFRANTADELKSALDDTLAAAKVPATPPPSNPEPSLLLHGKFCGDCEQIAPLDVHWKITRSDGTLIYDGLGVLFPDDPEFVPGQYKVSARYKSSALVRDAILVIGDDGQQVGEVNLNGGSAVMFAYASDDKAIAADPIHYQFFTTRDGNAVSKQVAEAASSQATIFLPAGRYKVVAAHDQVRESAEIEIIAGKETRHEFDMRVGYFKPSAVLSPGGKPLGSNMDYRIFRTEANASDSYAEGIGFVPGGSEKPLRPGKYVVRAILSYNRGTVRMQRIFPFEIKANEVSKPVFDMNAGLLSHIVKSTSGRRISNIDYIRENDGKRASYYNAGGSNTAALASGRYFLRILSEGKTHDSDPFAIEPGKTTTIDVTIP